MIYALKFASQALSRLILENPGLERFEPIRQMIIEAKNRSKGRR